MYRRNLTQSLIHALKGMYYACRSERNMAIHIAIGLIVVIMSFLLHVDRFEFLIILVCIALVIMAEMINTAFEFMVDLFHGAKISNIVKMLKDIASGAVLVACIFSAIIGILIFIPRLKNYF
ncbi:MAG: diacylglycerol kinase family protein [Candidatus Omnitrophica bacterium]|nr:diacylglycerol kinase family protein [Candidatus Omnitrophota bacterium]MDD5356467.1 diacylglycerol kinase family protein [Candidatus Omnitrophota bacterium]